MTKEKKNKFFNEIAIASGVVDIDIVQRIYYSLIRIIVKTMMADGQFEAPDLGVFHIKQRRLTDRKLIHMKETGEISAFNIMLFRACEYLKDHINNRQPHYQRKTGGGPSEASKNLSRM